jgi:hypothetical protein
MIYVVQLTAPPLDILSPAFNGAGRNRSTGESQVHATNAATFSLSASQRLAPRAWSVSQIVQLTGLCRDIVYRAIKAGHLKAKKFNGRTLVLDEDLQTFLRGLPDLQLPPAKARKAPRNPADVAEA